MIKNKKIFITGGAGYLGQNLVERYHGDNEITVYSRDEAKHYYLSKRFPSVKFVIGDFRNKDLLIKSCKGHDIGIFTASFKQIDACSYNPEEALQTIVHGSFNSKYAAIENNFQSACFISTDKSRAATTVYGAMKYVAGESFILNNENYKTNFTTAIYGNVMNSTGSLIPLIWKAIENDITLELYHPQMTRFMIDISEAMDLIEVSLSLSDVNVVPNIKSFLVKDIFEIYKDMFGLKYKVTKPRVNEKIHEIMASSEEIPRMKYLKKHDVYIIDPVKKFDDVDFKNDEYSSQNVVLSKEELSRYLENKGFYTS